ncbi:class F sortase [Spongiactinospora sp. TRM90649]|uniref:class F sortase n=1 Tax=Spongiactinospora sp. TRM90649 TaxID=3031114 RepID=UPI0023F7A2F4|nr:class F sortase [Spongiactinospora sp. TRM90649]MDF5751587.1 class F sortase [Spongiactinospora sp. TRM90649]
MSHPGPYGGPPHEQPPYQQQPYQQPYQYPYQAPYQQPQMPALGPGQPEQFAIGPGPSGRHMLGQDPYGRPARQSVKARLRSAVLPAVLIVVSLGGIAAIMAGLLAYLAPPPVQEGVLAAAPAAEPPAPQTAAVQQAADPLTLPTVGPGGPGVPLTPAEPAAPPPLPAVKAPPPVKTTEKTRPTRISIPAIGVSARLVSLGVQQNREIQVPPLNRPKLGGWYRYGPVPGEIGPAVILGHVNNRTGPAVFYRLNQVKRGQKIRVARNDGKIVEFTVDGVEKISKSTFPTARVYSNLNDASLRVITCGGIYDPKTGHYTDNIIVYATLSKRTR